MANNRMYLKHNPTGKLFMLGKRMGGAWYVPLSFKEELFDKFFEECFTEGAMEGHPDDFSIVLEVPVEENTPQVL